MIEVEKQELERILRESNGSVKIIAFYIDKGGTGKSTKSYNIAGYCADVLNKRVLVIDGDRSRNLSDSYGVFGQKTISDIFKTGEFEIYKTKNPNIDIISGSSTFTDRGVDIDSASTSYMEFIKWLDDHKEYIDKEYDFIIIDTHNDVSKVTLNLIAASHLVVNVATPDGGAYKGIDSLEDLLENELKPKTIPVRAKESVVDFDIVIMPNRITFNGNNLPKETRNFIDDMRERENFVGLVPERTILRESRLKGEHIFAHYASLPENKRKHLTKFINNMADIYDRVIYMACKKALESQ